MEFRSLHIRCVWTAVRRLFLCVRVRVRVSVNVSVTACVCVCVRARARARVCCQCLVVVPRQVSHQRTLRYRPRFFPPPPPAAAHSHNREPYDTTLHCPTLSWPCVSIRGCIRGLALFILPTHNREPRVILSLLLESHVLQPQRRRSQLRSQPRSQPAAAGGCC